MKTRNYLLLPLLFVISSCAFQKVSYNEFKEKATSVEAINYVKCVINYTNTLKTATDKSNESKTYTFYNDNGNWDSDDDFGGILSFLGKAFYLGCMSQRAKSAPNNGNCEYYINPDFKYVLTDGEDKEEFEFNSYGYITKQKAHVTNEDGFEDTLLTFKWSK